MPQHHVAGAATVVRQQEVGVTAARVDGGPAQEFTIVLEHAVPHSTTETDGTPAEEWIRRTIDGHVLEAVLGARPSAELLARHIHHGCAGLLPELWAVHVCPEPGVWVAYRP